MKFARIGHLNEEIPVVIADQNHDIRSITADINGEFFASGGVEKVRAALAAGELPVLADDGGRLGSPMARPGAVVCVGMNYAAHAAESGSAPPEYPHCVPEDPQHCCGPG